jgi:serine beta-lactamase-like protein LACTB
VKKAASALGLLEGLVTHKEVPGLAIQVNIQGKTQYCQGYGFSDLKDLRPVVPERTLFRIASISKPITATALVRLVELGVLSLDTDLREYVPEFPQKHPRVSLRQLASHTAGIRSYRGKEFALNQPYSIADSLPVFIDDPLEFSPGNGYLYNSFDFVLLSLAMERAFGKPFHELTRELVLDPLGMSRTHREIPGKPWPDQASFYTKFGKTFRKAVSVDNRYKLAGGGYLSTVSDVCRLGQAYLDNRIADERVLRPFLTSAVVGKKPTYYGLGWQVSQDQAGRKYYGHIGNAAGVYSNFFIYPEEQLVVCILMNCAGNGIQPVLDTVVDSLHQSLSAAE